MALYPPPTKTTGIFDSEYFTVQDDGLTIAEAEQYFLRYPTAQGNETFPYQVQFTNFAPHSNTLPTQYNDLTTKQYVDNIVGSNSGSGLLFYLNFGVSSGISTYKEFANQYSLLSTATNTTLSLGTNLIAAFITNSGVPNNYGSTISAGIFNLNLYAYVSVNTGTLNAYFTLSKYDTLTSTITLIATSGNSSDINGTNSTAPDLYHCSCSFPSTSFLTTDRLLLQIYTVGTGMGALATITTEYQGSYYSYVLTPISSGVNLVGSNNSWTGTNDFLNTVSLYQPTVSSGPLTMPVDSSILYGNTGTLSLGSSTNNITQTTGLRVPKYIDGVDLGSGLFLGFNHTTGFINMGLGVVCGGSGTTSQISVEYINARSNATGGTIYVGNNLASGGKIYMGNNITGTGVLSIGNATGANQSLSGIWTIGSVYSNTFVPSTTGSAVNLFTTATSTVNLATNTTGLISIGSSSSGNVQLPQNVRWGAVNTNVNFGTTTTTATSVNIFTGITTGTVNVGGASMTTGTINLISGTSSGTLNVGGTGTTINIGTTTTGTTTIGGAGPLSLNISGTSLTRLGNSGTVQLGVAGSILQTPDALRQITTTGGVSLYSTTTGSITLGTLASSINLTTNAGQITLNSGVSNIVLTCGALLIGTSPIISGTTSAINLGDATYGVNITGDLFLLTAGAVIGKTSTSIILGASGTTTSLTTPNSIVSLAVGTALSLFSTQTATTTLGGAGPLSLNISGNSLSRIGNLGTTQIGTSTSLISTSNNLQQITASNNITLYTLTTGNITLGTASTGTINLATGTATTVNLATGLTTGSVNIGSNTAGSNSQNLVGTWTVGNSLITNNINSAATTVNMFSTSTGTVSFGDNAADLFVGAGTNIGNIDIGSNTQTGSTTIYSNATGILLNAPLYSNYGSSFTVSRQIGWTDSGNTTQSSGNVNTLATYYVYSDGTGATMTQLLAGMYLFCCNGTFAINNGSGNVNSLGLAVISNSTNATASASVFKTLSSPPTTWVCSNTYAISPLSVSQVIEVPTSKNNHYFAFRGTFNLSSAFSTGTVRMVIDSYSITRVA